MSWDYSKFEVLANSIDQEDAEEKAESRRKNMEKYTSSQSPPNIAETASEFTLEEKNQKKRIAIDATREHGKILFVDGSFEHAAAVYERGSEIINGFYGISDEEFAKYELYEAILDTNQAACHLKLNNFTRAIDLCRIALKLDPSLIKAYYRWSQALAGMGNYDEAILKAKESLKIDPNNASMLKFITDLTSHSQKHEIRAKIKEKKFAKQLQAEFNKK